MENGSCVCLGVITKPVGIRGAVRIYPYTSSPAAFLIFRDCLLLDSRPLTCISARVDGPSGIVARFSEFQSRDSVEPLRKRCLFISREKLPPTQVDEYYLCDLFGLDVVAAADGRLIGKVLAAQDYGAGTFLEIMFLDNGKIGTLPFHRESVMAVNLAAKRITIIEKFLIH